MLKIARFVMLAFALSLLGCQTDKHVMAKPEPGMVSICTKCYDEIVVVRRAGNPRHVPGDTVVKRHVCEECKSDMTIYTEGGVMKVRCAKCAPEGVDCDLCTPKVAASSGNK